MTDMSTGSESAATEPVVTPPLPPAPETGPYVIVSRYVDYPVNGAIKRAEAGETVTDIPEDSVGWLLDFGYITDPNAVVEEAEAVLSDTEPGAETETQNTAPSVVPPADRVPFEPIQFQRPPDLPLNPLAHPSQSDASQRSEGGD